MTEAICQIRQSYLQARSVTDSAIFASFYGVLEAASSKMQPTWESLKTLDLVVEPLVIVLNESGSMFAKVHFWNACFLASDVLRSLSLLRPAAIGGPPEETHRSLPNLASHNTCKTKTPTNFPPMWPGVLYLQALCTVICLPCAL